jgi:hypothetical protein
MTIKLRGAAALPLASKARKLRKTKTPPSGLPKPPKKGNVVLGKGGKPTVVLSPSQEDDMIQKIHHYIKKFNLHSDSKKPRPQITHQIKGNKRGNVEKRKKTIREEYAPKWREVGRFAYLMGDDRTATLCCDELRPSKPHPAMLDTIQLF